jgi:hypothetical protein
VRVPRFRIAWVMAFIALVAVNLGAIRSSSGLRGDTRSLLHTGSLPMANVLVAGFLVGHRYPGSRRFLLGFEAFGGAALAFSVAAAVLFPAELCVYYLHFVEKMLFNAYGSRMMPSTAPTLFALGVFAIAAVMLVLPQLAFAVLGGFLSRKLSIIERPN